MTAIRLLACCALLVGGAVSQHLWAETAAECRLRIDREYQDQLINATNASSAAAQALTDAKTALASKQAAVKAAQDAYEKIKKQQDELIKGYRKALEEKKKEINNFWAHQEGGNDQRKQQIKDAEQAAQKKIDAAQQVTDDAQVAVRKAQQAEHDAQQAYDAAVIAAQKAADALTALENKIALLKAACVDKTGD